MVPLDVSSLRSRIVSTGAATISRYSGMLKTHWAVQAGSMDLPVIRKALAGAPVSEVPLSRRYLLRLVLAVQGGPATRDPRR